MVVAHGPPEVQYVARRDVERVPPINEDEVARRQLAPLDGGQVGRERVARVTEDHAGGKTEGAEAGIKVRAGTVGVGVLAEIEGADVHGGGVQQPEEAGMAEIEADLAHLQRGRGVAVEEKKFEKGLQCREFEWVKDCPALHTISLLEDFEDFAFQPLPLDRVRVRDEVPQPPFGINDSCPLCDASLEELAPYLIGGKEKVARAARGRVGALTFSGVECAEGEAGD